MQKRPWEISDLLALADGEPRDANVEVDTAEARRTLAEIETLRGQLQGLPDVPVDDDVWLAQLPKPKRSVWLRFPLATAASVCLTTALGIFWLAGGGPSDVPAQPSYATGSQIEPDGLRLAALMNQSRDLELRLAAPTTRQQQGIRQAAQNEPLQRSPAMSATERRLMYRLADVDAQIARLYEADAVDPNARVELWRQRVNVLESIAAVRAGQNPRESVDSRSM